MREGIKRTPMELLRAAIEEQGCEMPCGTLHEIHGDRRNICGDRNCIECKLDAMRKAADLVEAELDALKARSLPEGMEWPCYEDGEPVRFGDMALIDGDADMVEAVQLWIHGKPVIYGDGGSQQLERGERVKRPAPKVVDADGVEIRVGDTVYQMGCKYRVSHLHGANGRVRIVYENSGRWVDPKTLTHRAPVLAADGKPLREGETVYKLDDDWPHTLKRFDGDHVYINAGGISFDFWTFPNKLTHERPVVDTWERLEEDAANLDEMPCDYSAKDLVRRCRALAERERGER